VGYGFGGPPLNDARLRAYHEQGLAVARAADDAWSIAWALGDLAFHAEGDISTATTMLREALGRFRAIGDGLGISHMLRRLGWALTVLGEFDEANLLLEEALSRARAVRDENAVAWALYLLGNASWAESRDGARAQHLYAESLPRAREADVAFLVILLLFGLGQIALTEGDLAQAHALFQEVLSAYSEWGEWGWRVGHGLWGFAALAAARGMPARAAMLLGAADLRFEYLGLRDRVNLGVRDDAAFEADVASIGAQLGEPKFVAAWAEGRALVLQEAITLALADNEPFGGGVAAADRASVRRTEKLSPRERQVAELVAQGCTTRQIADALVITGRTVESHLERIYTRLGLHSRAQLATWLAEITYLDSGKHPTALTSKSLQDCGIR